MATKVIAGLVCAACGILVMCLLHTPLFVIAVAIVCGMVVYELNHAIGLKNKPMMIVSIAAGAIYPLCYEYGYKLSEAIGLNLKAEYLVGLYILALFFLMLAKYEETKFEEVAAVIVSSLGLPYAITRVLFFRDIGAEYPVKGYSEMHGLFFILFAFFAAWLTDAGAYFVGSFLGKHKLCPKISPKKTVEGAIGGVVFGTAFCTALYAVFDNFIFENPVHNYLAVILISAVLSIVAQCGDLSASVIKRNFGIKDFGNLVPGHGGVMDRFDSEVFVLVAFYAIFNIFEVSI